MFFLINIKTKTCWIDLDLRYQIHNLSHETMITSYKTNYEA